MNGGDDGADEMMEAIPAGMQKSIIALIKKTVEKEVAEKTAHLQEEITKLKE